MAEIYFFKFLGTLLVAQWMGLHTPKAGGLGSIPGWGTRSHIHAATKSSRATTKEPASRNEDLAQLTKYSFKCFNSF